MSLAPLDLLSLTHRSLWSNPLRSVLTMLGVFLGVASVSATLQVGSISRTMLAQQLAERDAPRVQIGLRRIPGRRQQNTLNMEDLEFLRRELTGAQVISGISWLPGTRVEFQGEQTNARMNGVTEDYLRSRGKPMLLGRFFNQADFDNYRPVVVLDELLASQLFNRQNPIGQQIYARNRPFTVVGVMPTEVLTDAAPEGLLLVPIALSVPLTGRLNVGTVQIRTATMQELTTVGERAEQLLKQRYPRRFFWQRNNVEDLLIQQQTQELSNRSLTVVGLIALLVGGVGIANIMIASVTERTAEIGLRRALGATRQEIMAQFILEAVLLSLIGGAIAITTVHLLTVRIAEQFTLPYQFETRTAGLAIGAAVFVGVAAAITPAIRASRLDPVKALRSE